MWPLTAFGAFGASAPPHCSTGHGWPYAPRARHLWISATGRSPSFDERLDNESYGELRGTGALVRTDKGWKILQYNLTFTVPNDAADDVVKRIRSGD